MNARRILINDMFLEDNPSGGAEHVDDMLIKSLKLDKIRSEEVDHFDKTAFYVVSNVLRLNQELLKELQSCNYIILEHGYQILNKPRRPWRFKNCIVPKDKRINYGLYRNAKAVFVQTTDHLNVFRVNDVEGNFINLRCSLWSDEDLNLLDELRKEEFKPIHSIYKSRNGIKNTHGAIKYCKEYNLPYELIGNKKTHREFLECLSKNHSLVFFPTARETFSRLAVEARCMGMDVITTKTYGATLEDWYEIYHGKELVDFLRKQTAINLSKIKRYVFSS